MKPRSKALAGLLWGLVVVAPLTGCDDFEIRQYMRDRYGDFVLYNPPLAGHTMILWFGPIVLLLIGLITGAVMIRRRRRMLADQQKA